MTSSFRLLFLAHLATACAFFEPDDDADGLPDTEERALGTDPLDAADGPYPTGWPQLALAAWEGWSELPTCQRGVILACRAPDVALPDFRGFDFRTRDLAAVGSDLTLVIASHGQQTASMARGVELGAPLFADV
ncbi:MAG: hypothetical protein RLZZ383_2392, partial [Pseudomonadota bacterium]